MVLDINLFMASVVQLDMFVKLMYLLLIPVNVNRKIDFIYTVYSFLV